MENVKLRKVISSFMVGEEWYFAEKNLNVKTLA